MGYLVCGWERNPGHYPTAGAGIKHACLALGSGPDYKLGKAIALWTLFRRHGMKSFVLILVLVLLAPVGKGGDADKPSKALEGTWKASSLESDGQKVAGDDVPDLGLVIKGDGYKELQNGNETEEGKIKLDPSKSPKALDFDIQTGNDQGKKQLGIYKVDGDTLTLCLARPGGDERPKEFAAPQGSSFTVIVFKRKKG
jgi:uncharacterized protein (TIGR03067 family)